MVRRHSPVIGILTLAYCLCAAGLDAAKPDPAGYTLRACIDRALEQNPQIRAAATRIEEASGRIIEARAGYWPSLTSHGRYQYREADYATLGGSQPDRRAEIWDLNVILTETVYSGGAVPARLAMARLEKDLRWLDYRATVDRVLMETRIAFYEVLRQQATIEAHRQAVDFYRRQAAHQQTRLEAGTGEKLQLLRATVNQALEEAALEEARKQGRLAELQLAELLDLEVADGDNGPGFSLTGRLDEIQPIPDREQCLARAQANRAELQTRRKQVGIQEEQLRLDRSALRPQVDLFAGYEIVNEPNRAAASDAYDGFIGGVAVRWLIFDGWATRGRVQATQARLDAARIDETATIQTVAHEVLRAHRELETAAQTIKTQTENVRLATESVELARENFEQGLINQLELIQSQLDLTRAQTARAGAYYDYQSAHARLDRATGSRFHLQSHETKGVGEITNTAQ